MPVDRRAGDNGASGDHATHTVEEIVALLQRDRLAMSRSDRIANRITAFSGSMVFVWLHVAWFAAWIPLNEGWFAFEPFDPFPFGLLRMIVSLEAIFLSTFVVISQNRQALQADRRAKVDLQVNLISEQEVTKLVQMVDEIRKAVGVDRIPMPSRAAWSVPRRSAS